MSLREEHSELCDRVNDLKRTEKDVGIYFKFIDRIVLYNINITLNSFVTDRNAVKRTLTF